MTRRVTDVFGTELPAESTDERDPDRDAEDHERWLKENVPPHHM